MSDFFVVNVHADHIIIIRNQSDDVAAARDYYGQYPDQEGKDITVYEVIKTANLTSKRVLTIEQVDNLF